MYRHRQPDMLSILLHHPSLAQWTIDLSYSIARERVATSHRTGLIRKDLFHTFLWDDADA